MQLGRAQGRHYFRQWKTNSANRGIIKKNRDTDDRGAGDGRKEDDVGFPTNVDVARAEGRTRGGTKGGQLRDVIEVGLGFFEEHADFGVDLSGGGEGALDGDGLEGEAAGTAEAAVCDKEEEEKRIGGWMEGGEEWSVLVCSSLLSYL